MTSRAQQRADTRERIVAAAAETFAERGFRGASTREIAARADANQGLITYHFRTKDELWRAAADQIVGSLRKGLVASLAAIPAEEPRERARESIREYVRFAAANPEFFHLMMEEGKQPSDRMAWIVDTHLRPLYDEFLASNAIGAAELAPHAFYVLVGAGSILFAVAPECRRLTGLDPETPEAIETHAEFVARLLVP